MHPQTREVLAHCFDVELFAYAVTHGFSLAPGIPGDPTPRLRCAIDPARGTPKAWDIPYNLNEGGFPVFTRLAREHLISLLAGEVMPTRNILLEHGTANDAFMPA